MNRIRCDGCGGEFAMNESLRVQDQILCLECGEQILSDNKSISPENVERQMDPTVCIHCEMDNGQESLETMAGVPTCEQCQEYFRHRPFPGWIKAAAVGLVSLVIFSLVWNAKFVRAYFEMRDSFVALVEGDIEVAAAKMHTAWQRAPESEPLKVLAAYQRGILRLREDEPAEALAAFESCRERLGPEFQLDLLIMQAQSSIAFDNKDYDKFLEAAIAFRDTGGIDSHSLGMLTSAYACKYADTGDEEFKQKSLSHLEQVEAMSSEEDWYEEFDQRIRHRLHSREVIDLKEFQERFPDGWTEPQE